MSDLGDIQIVSAPRLAKLDTFKTDMLSVDRNSPLARALDARIN